jgi:hypothetical protein
MFGIIDFAAGYHQTPLHPDFSFTKIHGLYEYVYMFFPKI